MDSSEGVSKAIERVRGAIARWRKSDPEVSPTAIMLAANADHGIKNVLRR